MSWLRPGRTLLALAATLVLVAPMNAVTGRTLNAHAAPRITTQTSPTPAPDQTQPQQPTPTAPVSQPGSASTPAPSQGISASTSAPTREVFGFTYSASLGDPNVGYPSWNFNLLSTVSFFSLHATTNGNLVADSDWNVFNSSTFTNFVTTAHAHGVKVVVTISPLFGYSDFTDFCDTLYNSQGTVGQLVPQIKAKGLDGVNIDYEGQLNTCHATDPTLPASISDQALVTQLAQNMRNGLNSAGAGNYLTIDTYTGSALGNDGFFNIPNLNQYVDAFFVMAYDMDFSNATSPPLNCSQYCLNPNSPLTNYYWNVSNSMSTYSSVVGSGKVIMGQPYYGEVGCVSYPYAHSVPTSNFQAVTYLGSTSVATSPDVSDYSTGRDGVDPAGLDAWTTWYDSTYNCWREMYWNDTTTLGTKYNLVNRDNLRGVGIWTLNYGGGAPELWDLLSAYFQTWSAGYDTSQVPTSWVAGQTQTFPVTVTNSGSFTWPSGGSNPVQLDMHFATSPNQAPTSWLTSQVFSLPSDVAPGASATVNVTVTAPMTTGTLYLEAETLKNHQFWFAQRQPVLTTIAPQVWTAKFDLSQAPANWQAGQAKTFSITVTNTGNVTWSAGGTNPVELDLHFTSKAGGAADEAYWLTSQIFPLAADLPPNQSATISVTVTAPTTTGYLSLEAGVFMNHLFWFTSAQASPVTVFGAYGATYDMSQAPASWAPGETKSFSVTVTNQGTQTWPAGGTNPVELDLHFATAAGGSAAEAGWLTSQIYPLAADVAPGGAATLAVSVTAPSASGHLVLEAALFKNHQFWFQQWQPVSVTVAAIYTATYDMTQAPTSWVAGQSQTFPVTVTNTGNVTWPATGYTEADLDLHFAKVAGGSAQSAQWLTSEAFALPANLAPGASATVSVTITAPSNLGSLVLEAEMIKEHQFWFQQAQPVNVTVAAATWSATYDMTKAPTTWTHGQAQTFTVTVTNKGNVTWPATGYTEVDLDLHFTTVAGGSAQSGSWLTSQAFSLPGSVAPNASVTVTVTITAPATTGSMFLEAELIKEHQFWFTPTQAVRVTVS